MRLESGLLLGGRFRLVNRLSRGRFGELWRGADRVPSRCVAIRVVRPPDDAALAEAWLEELRAACTLEHRNVARLLAVGRLERVERSDEPLSWIASELLVGETLDDLLARRGKLPAGAVLQLCADLAGALAEAHARGVVHGAIEPRAILLHRGDDASITAKLVDFGRARWRASVSVDRELGPYDCPALAADDPSRDVWALGALVVRAVSGRVPVSAQSEAAFLAEAGRLRYALENLIADERVRRLAVDCLSPEQRVDSAELAARARLAASTAQGGWTALERMVRVPDVYLDVERFGALDHWRTIPGIAPVVAPPCPQIIAPREMVVMPSVAARAVDPVEHEDEQPVSIPLPAAPEPPRRPPERDLVAPILDEPVDLRSHGWRWRAAAAAAVVAVVAVVAGALSTREQRTLPRGIAHAGALPAATSPPAPVAPTERTDDAPAVATVAPSATPSVATSSKRNTPVQPVTAAPSRGGASRAPAKKPASATAAPIPKNAGIPLWEAPKERVVNPYE